MCGDNLPWVDSFKHLGNTIINKSDFVKQDVNIKRAQVVNKNIELNQEFFSCYPQTKFEINQIFNSHYTGSPLWNLSSPEVLRLEGSYNLNIKISHDLPYDTHRFLIEPITGKQHLRTVLKKRFMNFLSQIMKSSKKLPTQMLRIIKCDMRSNTGGNLDTSSLSLKKLV